MNWLPWAPLAAAGLHIVEEFVFPGGFAAWERRYRSDIRTSLTTRYLAIVNVLFLILCYDAGAKQLVIPMNPNNGLAFVPIN